MAESFDQNVESRDSEAMEPAEALQTMEGRLQLVTVIKRDFEAPIKLLAAQTYPDLPMESAIRKFRADSEYAENFFTTVAEIMEVMRITGANNGKINESQVFDVIDKFYNLPVFYDLLKQDSGIEGIAEGLDNGEQLGTGSNIGQDEDPDGVASVQPEEAASDSFVDLNPDVLGLTGEPSSDGKSAGEPVVENALVGQEATAPAAAAAAERSGLLKPEDLPELTSEELQQVESTVTATDNERLKRLWSGERNALYSEGADKETNIIPDRVKECLVALGVSEREAGGIFSAFAFDSFRNLTAAKREIARLRGDGEKQIGDPELAAAIEADAVAADALVGKIKDAIAEAVLRRTRVEAPSVRGSQEVSPGGRNEQLAELLTTVKTDLAVLHNDFETYRDQLSGVNSAIGTLVAFYEDAGYTGFDEVDNLDILATVELQPIPDNFKYAQERRLLTALQKETTKLLRPEAATSSKTENSDGNIELIDSMVTEWAKLSEMQLESAAVMTQASTIQEFWAKSGIIEISPLSGPADITDQLEARKAVRTLPDGFDAAKEKRLLGYLKESAAAA